MPDRLEDIQPFVRPQIPGQPPQSPIPGLAGLQSNRRQ